MLNIDSTNRYRPNHKQTDQISRTCSSLLGGVKGEGTIEELAGFVKGKFCENSLVVRPLRPDNKAEAERWIFKYGNGADIGADNRARADKHTMKAFLLNLKVFFSPEKENTLQPDKQPGRKPPSVMPKPPIAPPKYQPDYPDVDDMYRRFVAAGKHTQYRAKQSRKRSNFLK